MTQGTAPLNPRQRLRPPVEMNVFNRNGLTLRGRSTFAPPPHNRKTFAARPKPCSALSTKLLAESG